MPKIDLKPRAKKFIKSLPPKHKRQVKDHILSLADNRLPHDTKKLIGYEDYLRTDIGEYRIIYRYEPKPDIVIGVLVGKRSGDEIYRIAKRLL
ncbi:MAG: type II toxin-antitoxin system RelE/ParE family toxin [Proteobacteria bacterium]|nr:type II toxin-antitoxin system RelE/ParE family toxin [Pseudomonadota bacterium]